MVNKKYLIAFVLNIVLIGILVLQIFRLCKENYIYKRALSENIRIETEKREYSRNLNEIKNIIKENCSVESPTEIIRHTMQFVHDNSVHLVDSERKKYSIDIPLVIKQLLLAYTGQQNKRPQLSCGSHSFVMREVLNRFGIKSRLIQIFSDEYGNVRGHRMLEVFNPQEKKWEIWDPYYRVTYVDQYSKKRMDIVTLVFGDLDRIVPKNGVVKGWARTGTEDLRESYFEAFSLERFDKGIIEGTMNTTIIFNRTKFNINKIFSDGLTFQQWAVRHYQHPRFIVFPYRSRT